MSSTQNLIYCLEEAIEYIENMVDSSGEDNGESEMIERFESVIDKAKKEIVK